jgi:hypothetical protein
VVASGELLYDEEIGRREIESNGVRIRMRTDWPVVFLLVCG